MTDDVSEVRRADQATSHANEVWRSFAIRCFGSVVEISGTKGTVEISAEHLSEVPEIARQYAETIGDMISIGIGMRLSESAKALQVSKNRGGNQTVLWNDDLKDELEETNAPKESLLGKAQGGGNLDRDAGAPAANVGSGAGFEGHTVGPRGGGTMPASGDHEQAKAMQSMLAHMKEEAPAPAEETHAAEDFESLLHQHALGQENKEKDNIVRGDHAREQLKAQLVQVLTKIKEQMPAIAQMQQAAPDAYASIMGLVQGVIAMGSEVLGPSAGIAKSSIETSSLAKGVATIPKGKMIGQTAEKKTVTTIHDYNHVLPPGHAIKGLKLEVHEKGDGKGFVHSITAKLMHRDKPVGGVVGEVEGQNNLEPHSHLKPEYRGVGLGQSMYEALYAHAKNSLGISRVEGGVHSADASKLHTHLAKKHGFEYTAKPRTDTEAGASSFPFQSYSYALKEELAPTLHEDQFMGGDPIRFVRGAVPMQKGIADLKPGKKLRERVVPKSPTAEGFASSHDYNHLLKPEHVAAGLRLEVHHSGLQEEGFEPGSKVKTNEQLRAKLLDPANKLVGSVEGYVVDGKKGPSIEPHSELEKPFRGKGLGTAMYEALYAHAKHVVGITEVSGGIHSADADRVHQSLAKKHGFKYKSRLRSVGPDGEGGSGFFPYSGYNYALKEEMSPSIHEDHFMGPGMGLLFHKDTTVEPELTKDETSTHYGDSHPVCGSPKKTAMDKRWYMTDCAKCKASPAFLKAKSNAKARVATENYSKEELKDEYSESPATKDGELDKGSGPMAGTPSHHHLHLPVGSELNGKVRVAHASGDTSWVEVKAGMIQSQDPTGHPVSARNPGAK